MVSEALRIKKLMLIEDDAAIQHAVSLLFARDTFDVHAYADGKHLLHGDIDTPDIFLIDKQLPGVDGIDLCRYLKQQASTASVPVIIMSASPLVRQQAMQAGASGFIEKPYRAKDLREMVRKLTDS